MKSYKLSILALFIILAGCLDNSGFDYDDTEDLAFLEEYAQRDGVTKTDSGLMYRIIEEGEGYVPGPNDIVVLDMIVKHVVNDEVVIDTYDDGNPRIVSLEYLTTNLTGLKEAVQHMKMDAVYEVVLPSELSWRDDKVYSFEVELVTTQDIFIASYAKQEGVTVTNSGLMYRVIEEGEGEKPGESSVVSIKYKGTFINGEEFPSGPSQKTVSEYIDGFSEGLQLMTPGSTYEFLIPEDLAYGDNPPQNSPIYPGAALLFEVELVEIQ